MTEPGEYVVTPQPTRPLHHARRPQLWTPPVARNQGSGWVSILGMLPMSIDAEAAIEFGHRLIEAGLGARVKKEVSNSRSDS